MATVSEYALGSDPQAVAVNDGSEPRSYLYENLTAVTTAQWLGGGQQLGEGITIDAHERESFDLASGEKLYAAAPDGDGVVLRVLEFRSA